MKRIISIVILLLLLSITSGSCSKDKQAYFYYGYGDTWLATYSIIKVDSFYYDSIYIQSLYDNGIVEGLGPIEYQLIGNSMVEESQFPQELKGVGNFHTGAVMNKDLLEVTFDDKIELTVYWNNTEETFALVRD